MKPKRKVSTNLGRTQHKNAEILYDEFSKKYSSFKICPFYGGTKYSNYDKNSHDRLNPNFKNPNVPIYQFDFLKDNKGFWSDFAQHRDQ